jgi:hypothetical protein
MNKYYLRFTEDGSGVGHTINVQAENKEAAILKGFKKLSKRDQERIDYCEVIEDAGNK